MVKRIDFSRETPESRRIYVNQWDYGLVLHITGIQAKEAHFAVEGSLDNALVVPLAEEGGILSANVPDRFLTQEREIYAYLYEETGEDGRTVGKVTIHVKPRAKPEDYIYTPEELKRYEALEEDIADTVVKRVDMSDVPSAGETVYTIEPNKLYIFPEMARLAIDFAEPENAGIANEYHVFFSSGDTATELILPDGILTDLVVESDKIYELSILEGCLAYQSWEVSV